MIHATSYAEAHKIAQAVAPRWASFCRTRGRWMTPADAVAFVAHELPEETPMVVEAVADELLDGDAGEREGCP